jgi:hypothetical protein
MKAKMLPVLISAAMLVFCAFFCHTLFASERGSKSIPSKQQLAIKESPIFNLKIDDKSEITVHFNQKNATRITKDRFREYFLFSIQDGLMYKKATKIDIFIADPDDGNVIIISTEDGGEYPFLISNNNPVLDLEKTLEAELRQEEEADKMLKAFEAEKAQTIPETESNRPESSWDKYWRAVARCVSSDGGAPYGCFFPRRLDW